MGAAGNDNEAIPSVVDSSKRKCSGVRGRTPTLLGSAASLSLPLPTARFSLSAFLHLLNSRTRFL